MLTCIDVEAAQKLLRLGSAIVKSLSTEIELGETAMKSLKFVKAAGTVISDLGVLIDAILLVIAAIKGAEQRKELEEYVTPPNNLAFIVTLFLTVHAVQSMTSHTAA